MNTLIIRDSTEQRIINRHVYGHFAEHLGRCIYEGIWVGEESPIPNTRGIRNDVVEALRRINVPNLRWPGGCFADDYHWQDGIGPRAQRPQTINMWGHAPESNHFGTHEFLELCDQLGCEPYICGNVGSGTPQEMQQWVEYLTADGDSTMARLRRQNGREAPWKIPFWGVGNENWGCGGHMTPEYYGDLYSRFQSYLRSYGDNTLMKIAGGYGGSDTTGEGLERFLRHTLERRHPVRTEGVSLHYYVYLRNDEQHSATQFGESEWFTVLRLAAEIEQAIQNHVEVMDRYDPEKRMWLIVDEWGTWYPAEPGTNPAFLYQQNALRDAVVAALTLHIFHRYCDRVQMANIAQTVNVLQAMILTEGERMLLTPTYHVFDMFKGHQDAILLPLELDCESYSSGGEFLPAVSASASRSSSGEILLTLCNLNPQKNITLDGELQGLSVSRVEGQILTAEDMTAHNTFDQPDRVRPAPFAGAALADQRLTIDLPARSVVALTLS